MHSIDRKNIAIFIKSLQGGGAERSTVNLANALAETGHSVDLIMIKKDDTGCFTTDVSDKVKIVLLEEASSFKFVARLICNPKQLFYLFRLYLIPGSPKPGPAVPGLVNYIKRRKPDALLSALDYANVAAVMARRLIGHKVRIVLGQRNQLTNEFQNYPSWRMKQVVPTLRYFYSKADAIACVSEGVARDLTQRLRLAHDKAHPIYNAVTNKALLNQSSEQVDHPWFNDRRIPVILAAGKLKRQKDFVTLLESFAKVSKIRECRLVILGKGPMRAELDKLAADLNLTDKIWFAGFVENPFKFMANADLFVLSSIYEGLPGVLIQALSCGCPVVSTDCPSGPSEILDNGKYGRLVPVGNSEILAKTILEELDLDHDRERLRERGRFFSEEAAVNAYLKLLFPQS